MRLIFVIGGVISGVGKGIVTASVGKILQQYGFSTSAIKIDPYLNFDAGTLRPTEHGEVWVTYDGGEIDQDLGNYERFLGHEISKINNITTGQVYNNVIEKERHGEFLGKTVQIFPHIIEEIKSRIKKVAENHEFTLVEIGGTVGDYENAPFMAACKELERELGVENTACLLVSYLPIPSHINEMKTKPTQRAVTSLNNYGFTSDFIFCRAKTNIDEIRKDKIHVFCNVKKEHIISAPDENNIYKIPLNFVEQGLGEKLLKKFNLEKRKTPDWEKWKKITENKKKIKIAMVGKYVNIGECELADSYISVNHALQHAAYNNDLEPEISWVDSTTLNPEILKEYEGLVIPGGFGTTGIEGKIAAIKFARENNIPFIGLCYGMQLAIIEYARNVCGLSKANTTEADSNTPHPIIDIIDHQKKMLSKNEYGATMRLGAYAAQLKPNTKVYDIYNNFGRFERDKERIEKMEQFRVGSTKTENAIVERHRHRYEINPLYIELIEKKGMIFSGQHITETGTKLMEFIELPNHPFFIATQGHPEFLSYPTNPAPLFNEFIKAVKEHSLKKGESISIHS